MSSEAIVSGKATVTLEAKLETASNELVTISYTVRNLRSGNIFVFSTLFHTDEQAHTLARETKPIIHIDGGLHATEVANHQHTIQLGHDLVASEELELRPGETVEFKLSVESGSRYVGVLAAYRDLRETQWRYVVPVTPADLTVAELTLDQTGIHDKNQKLAKADD